MHSRPAGIQRSYNDRQQQGQATEGMLSWQNNNLALAFKDPCCASKQKPQTFKYHNRAREAPQPTPQTQLFHFGQLEEEVLCRSQQGKVPLVPLHHLNGARVRQELFQCPQLVNANLGAVTFLNDANNGTVVTAPGNSVVNTETLTYTVLKQLLY